MTLFELNKQFAEFEENACKYVNEETGEFDEEAYNKDFEELGFALDEKLENCGIFIKNTKAEIEMLKAEKKALDERIKVKENAVERVKNTVTFTMNINEKDKFETSKVVLSFRKSESVNIFDEVNVPEEFTKTTIKIEPNKTEIKKAIKSGIEVSGCELVENKNLQIK